MQRFAIALLAIASLAAQAEEAKPSREREALRRAQAALRAAQEQQSTLQADKAKSEAAATAIRNDLDRTKAQAAGVAARLKAREAALEELQVRSRADASARLQIEASASEREQTLERQLAAVRQESASRQQANLALVQLLEGSRRALTEAEARNQTLYAMGHELLQRYTGRSAVDTALLQDPLLGLTAVRIEDDAEKLRARLDTLRPVTRTP